MPAHIPAPSAPPPRFISTHAPGNVGRIPALDFARVSLTVLVVVHHAVLAYHRYAPKPTAFGGESLIWAAFPVVDGRRAVGVDALTLWNDSFFMAMLFLISGLFVATSLAGKGPLLFIRDRAIRLGLPFVAAAGVLAPLAYLPAYATRAADPSLAGFWRAWLSLGVWPAGPAWFLWVLLAFGGLAALLYAVTPRVGAALGRLGTWCRHSPVRAGLVLGAAALVAYLPTARWINPTTWVTWGPFTVQTGRVGLYLVYFFFGYAVGSGGPAALREWMAPDGRLARGWRLWQAVAGGVFVAFVAALIAWLVGAGQGKPSPAVGLAATALFALTGAATTLALLAGFARWAPRVERIVESVSPHAFGVYLVHYVFVTWLQYLLLPAEAPGPVKAVGVSVGAVALSLGATALLRRIPVLRHGL